MQNTPTPSTESRLHSGLLVALAAFALTWFLVNGESLPSAQAGALEARGISFCVVSDNRPTSWFFNTPVQISLPVYGS